MEASSGNSSESEPFEVSSAAETAAAEPTFEGTNVCRVAALSTMLGGDRETIRDLAAELSELGFSDQLVFDERTWRDADPLDAFASLQGEDGVPDRVRHWRMLNETSRRDDAIAFLVAVLGSELERESAAAASALWRQMADIDPSSVRQAHPGAWLHLYDLEGRQLPHGTLWPFMPPLSFDPDAETDDLEVTRWNAEEWVSRYRRVTTRLGADPSTSVFLISSLAQWRLGRALRSTDAVTRSLAQATFVPTNDRSGAGDATTPTLTPDSRPAPGAPAVSTMIHGTWAWSGRWWEPGGDFHKFILTKHRSNLYERGAPYHWNGSLWSSRRRLAANRLVAWAAEMAGQNGLQTVFAHSYGADVAAGAVLAGAPVAELVLLSAPVTQNIEAAAATQLRMVDVRLRFDPILALTRAPQRIRTGSNVTTVLLKRWRFDHGASHSEVVWTEEDVATRGLIGQT